MLVEMLGLLLVLFALGILVFWQFSALEKRDRVIRDLQAELRLAGASGPQQPRDGLMS
ncbi:hypothetical protein [Phreatobacter oligotrophus]|jgi:hypothetical protein|uniref:hypothetical protein n=1 Tax=Phreatobacter oligotrophus TaxID=1122261 RepID=UPI002353B640|nr:hypothetical protein [Phreatobacter oligotrophus]MBX9992080.1 hypothetical protein [Phreatobacter oligotrophus]